MPQISRHFAGSPPELPRARNMALPMAMKTNAPRRRGVHVTIHESSSGGGVLGKRTCRSWREKYHVTLANTDTQTRYHHSSELFDSAR